MSPVAGDPASLSSCAATLGVLSRGLDAQGRALDDVLDGLGEGWPGRRSVHTRRLGAAVAEGAARTADELEQVGRVLQDQATDLADLVHRTRALEERARSAGLEVREDRVVPTLGVLAAADARADRRREESAARLQAELDLLLAQHRRRRDFVLGVLRESAERLADLSAGLRR